MFIRLNYQVQLDCHENSDLFNKDEVPLALWGSQLSLIATWKGYNSKLVIKDKPQAQWSNENQDPIVQILIYCKRLERVYVRIENIANCVIGGIR